MTHLLNDTITIYAVATNQVGDETLTSQGTIPARFVNSQTLKMNHEDKGQFVQIMATVWTLEQVERGSIIQYNGIKYKVHSSVEFKDRFDTIGYKQDCVYYDN